MRKKLFWFALFAALFAWSGRDGQAQNPPQPTLATIQPDCLIPFTLAAAGNFPATTVAGGPGDNRTKGCAAWTLMYQNTGMTSVTVTLQSASTTGTSPSFGSFAGTISTGYVNPIVSDTGGSVQAKNGTADISWVRVNVAATGTGTLTGVLYGFRNSSAAVNAPSTLSPCGPTVGEVQLYGSATTFTCDPNFTWAPNGFAPSTVKGLNITPTYTDLSIFPTAIQGGVTVFDVSDQGNQNQLMYYFGVAIADGEGSVTGVGSIDATYNFVTNNNTRAGKTLSKIVASWNEVDQYGTTPITDAVAIFNDFSPNGSSGVVTNLRYVWNSAPSGGTPVTNIFEIYNDDIGSSGATNPYYSWDDSRGVRRVKEDSAFNSVGQAIEALYNPQFTKYTPGTPNYERLILGEFNSNVEEIGSYAGGTGTVRDLRLLSPTLRIGTASNIANTTFTGAGLNDGVFNGTYTGATLTYCAIIDATGTPDTFKWGTNGTCDNGAATVAITGANQALSSGVVIKFAATTGHTATNKWSAVATAATDLWQFQSATYDTLAPKSAASAVAPGAGNAAFRWLAGTNAGTCKLVSNAGTSATEVTIIDNVGGGC